MSGYTGEMNYYLNVGEDNDGWYVARGDEQIMFGLTEENATEVCSLFKTIEQLTARVRELEEENARWKNSFERTAENTKTLLEQLAATQEEISGLLTRLREMTEYANKRNDQALDLQDQLAKAEQLWQVAQGRCDGLEEKLAKEEQRVAEAIATMFEESGTGGIFIAEMVRNSKWRKFVKEV